MIRYASASQVAPFVLASLLACGCLSAAGSDDGDGPVDEHGDVTGDVTFMGQLGWGDSWAQEQSFEADAAFQAFTFVADSQAIFDIEVTQAGTSRDLDTTLYVFGPADRCRFDCDRYRPSPWGSELARDDNSGWGDLSRVTAVESMGTGTHTVIVGTAAGLGRGHYRLKLNCAQESCRPSDRIDLIPTAVAPSVADLFSAPTTPSRYHWLDAYLYESPGYPVAPAQIFGTLAVTFGAQYGSNPSEWRSHDEIAIEEFSEFVRSFGLNADALLGALGVDDRRVARLDYRWNCGLDNFCQGALFAVIDDVANSVTVLDLGIETD